MKRICIPIDMRVATRIKSVVRRRGCTIHPHHTEEFCARSVLHGML